MGMATGSLIYLHVDPWWSTNQFPSYTIASDPYWDVTRDDSPKAKRRAFQVFVQTLRERDRPEPRFLHRGHRPLERRPVEHRGPRAREQRSRPAVRC